MEEVISYNERQNYPTSYINNNRKDLSIQYRNNIDFFVQQVFGAIYMLVLNILGLPITKGEWEDFSEAEKRVNQLIKRYEIVKASKNNS